MSEGCRITVWPTDVGPLQREDFSRCGEPVVDLGLCAEHLADRERLL